VLRTLEDSPFAGRTGVGVTVAVLDSGVHSGHPHVGEVRRGTNLTGVGEPANWIDRIGHGTAVTAAIREKSPSVEILAVRVFDRQLATNVAVLAEAIVWSADAGAQLINLSLGTSNLAHVERLADAVAHAATRGALVVSARRSGDVEWLPGSLPGVRHADVTFASNQVRIRLPKDPLKGWQLTQAVVARLSAELAHVDDATIAAMRTERVDPTARANPYGPTERPGFDDPI